MVALPALALGWLAEKLLPQLGGPSLGGAPLWMVVVGVVLVSPFVETVLMTGLIALVARFAGPTVAAIASAAAWGIAHSMAAARWGLVIWWPFLIFSIAYVTWRGRGYWRAVGIVFAIHALQNAGPIAALLLLR